MINDDVSHNSFYKLDFTLDTSPIPAPLDPFRLKRAVRTYPTGDSLEKDMSRLSLDQTDGLKLLEDLQAKYRKLQLELRKERSLTHVPQ